MMKWTRTSGTRREAGRGENERSGRRGGKSILRRRWDTSKIIVVLKFIGYWRCVWVNLPHRVYAHVVYGFSIFYASQQNVEIVENE